MPTKENLMHTCLRKFQILGPQTNMSGTKVSQKQQNAIQRGAHFNLLWSSQRCAMGTQCRRVGRALQVEC